MPSDSGPAENGFDHDIDILGIVSNGQSRQFYKLTRAGEIFETELYTTAFLPELLGALDYVCGECTANVPVGVGAPCR